MLCYIKQTLPSSCSSYHCRCTSSGMLGHGTAYIPSNQTGICHVSSYEYEAAFTQTLKPCYSCKLLPLVLCCSSCSYKCMTNQTALASTVARTELGCMLLKLSIGGLCLHSCACNERSQTSSASHLLFSAKVDVLKKSALLYTSLQTDRNRQKITGSTTRTVTCTLRAFDLHSHISQYVMNGTCMRFAQTC